MPATSTEFVAINWNNMQLIDEDSLDQMNNNINWLKNNNITGQYQLANGATTSTGLKILAGKTNLNNATLTYGAADIFFAKAFTPNSSPVVTCSMWSSNQVSALNVYGLDGTTTTDHRGFKVYTRKIDFSVYQDNSFLNWIAVGY